MQLRREKRIVADVKYGGWAVFSRQRLYSEARGSSLLQRCIVHGVALVEDDRIQF